MSDRPKSPAEKVAALRDAVLSEPVPARSPAEALPAPPEPAPARPAPEPPSPPLAPSSPARPDGAAVNQAWDLGAVAPPEAGGLQGWIARVVARRLARLVEAQTDFNSRQVQLDNQILEYLDARFDATHRHYDEVLGLYGKHLQDADQRHVLLEKELVAHVHDLVKRIDLVLEHGERARVELESTLRGVRTRLKDLEDRLAAQTDADALDRGPAKDR